MTRRGGTAWLSNLWAIGLDARRFALRGPATCAPGAKRRAAVTVGYQTAKASRKDRSPDDPDGDGCRGSARYRHEFREAFRGDDGVELHAIEHPASTHPAVLSVALLLGLLLAVGASPALADPGDPETGEVSGETAGAPAPDHGVLPVIAEGVTIAGIPVGGMTADEATAAVLAAFKEPVVIKRKKRLVKATPERLGARAYVPGAVRRAIRAAPGEEVQMVVAVKGDLVRSYVAKLVRRFSRKAKNSRLRMKGATPVITKSKRGVRVDRWATTRAIVRALKQNLRERIRLPVEIVEPAMTRRTFGHVIVIRRGAKKLSLYRGARRGAKLRRTFPVATGLPAYPTPLGRFTVGTKWANPWWYPPNSDWARGLEAVPPGPGNPLGTRWMGLAGTLVGIHGTPDAASVGYSASHGCIRMHVPSAEWLFSQITIGTPVIIVRS